MTTTLFNIINYIKNPVLEKDQNKDFNYRIKEFINILGISLITGFIIALIIGMLTSKGVLTIDNHAMEDIMDQFPLSFVFFITVVIAPILEELLFRAPLTLFKKKNTFRIAFYSITLLFGLVHISNYELTTRILIFTPILVSPQILLGFYLGYLRVRFGLLWAIALHACFNGILMSFEFI